MSLPSLIQSTQQLQNPQIPNPHRLHLLHLSQHLRLGLPTHPRYPTLPSLLSSATRLRSPSVTRQLHTLAVKSDPDVRTTNSLLHLYSASGILDSALLLFDRMPHPSRDVVSYTTLISAAVDSSLPDLALSLYDAMPVPPNDATVVSVLRACGMLGALTIGRRVHSSAIRLGIASKRNVSTALIDMYSKCGSIDIAERLFAGAEKDLVSWTAMISGLASHGRSRDAVGLFDKMVDLGLKPDEKTVTAVLSACRSSGWVCEGFKIYNNMRRKFGLRPKIQHYGCMVDLLARVGRLEEAEGFVRRMPVEPDSLVWRNLIWASRFHGDLERAKRLIEETRGIELDSGNGDGYVLIGNVYASDANWEEKARVRELMATNRVSKLPGCSRIEVKGAIHEFEAGDSKHPDRERIYRKWKEIAERLRSEGYKPKFSEVLLDVEDEEKAAQLNHHSEKLALAFGLISTNPGEEILIVKNLRACKDCHSAMKLVSKIYDRKIVVRDRIRFHHFSNGECSCGDYW